MWKDLSENTSLTPSSRTFCKPQGLWDCLGREKSKRGSPFPTVPDSTKRKDKLERTISDTSGNTSAFSQSSSRPCLSGKPSPRNPFPFKTICITFTRMEMNTRWGTITSYPYTQSGIGIPWLYSDLACSFFRLAQFWSLWNLNLGLLGGGGGAVNKQLNCHFPKAMGWQLCRPENNSKRSQWQILYAFQQVGCEGRNHTDLWFLSFYVSNFNSCMVIHKAV